MAEGDLRRETRRLAPHMIDGRPVYARVVTNKDLARKDEMDDEIAELRLRYAKLAGEDAVGPGGERVHVPGDIDECEDVEERKAMRAEARAIAAELRDRDSLLLDVYIVDENGESFPDEVLINTPFRDLNRLSQVAANYAYGVEDSDEGPKPDERPTTARNASG